MTNYLPYTDLIKKSKVKTFMAVGKLTLDKKKWIAKVAQILAEKLDCGIVTFPGHHVSFINILDEWSASL